MGGSLSTTVHDETRPPSRSTTARKPWLRVRIVADHACCARNRRVLALGLDGDRTESRLRREITQSRRRVTVRVISFAERGSSAWRAEF